MPPPDITAAFFCVSLLLAFSPGPDNLFVLAQSATLGRRAGMLVVLGLCTGLVVHTAMMASGLAVVFAASPFAFTALKSIGSAYLLFLAWQAFADAGSATDTAPAAGVEEGTASAGSNSILSADITSPQPLGTYARGIFMNLTNPKVILFFLAFLPQFVQSDRGPVALQLCWFGFIFMLATLLAFGLIA